jgi:transcriptional regulator with XRE-family HTH domain
MLQDMTENKDEKILARKYAYKRPIEDDAEDAWRDGLALRLRALFILRDLKSVDVARGLGISEARLSNWLQGIACPPAYHFHLLDKRFGVSTDYLINENVKSLDPDSWNALRKGARAFIKSRRPDLIKD